MAANEVDQVGEAIDEKAMTQEEIIAAVGALPGVVVLTAAAENGAPQVAWGDTFFSYDPDGGGPANSDFPFATIVTQDYPGFDMASNLDRVGVFRLNIAVGRDAFRDLLGYPPAAHAQHHADIDYSAGDELLPHPVYAAQGWVSIVTPGSRTTEQARTLLALAHGRASARHRKR